MAKKTKNKKSDNEKSILGKNAIFTPNVINDIHIKSQLGCYRMRQQALFPNPVCMHFSSNCMMIF